MSTLGTSDTREREKKTSISKKVEHAATQYCAKCERVRISNFYFDGLTVVFPEWCGSKIDDEIEILN